MLQIDFFPLLILLLSMQGSNLKKWKIHNQIFHSLSLIQVGNSYTKVLHPHPRNFTYNRSRIHPGSTQSSMEVSYGKITNLAQDFEGKEICRWQFSDGVKKQNVSR